MELLDWGTLSQHSAVPHHEFYCLIHHCCQYTTIANTVYFGIYFYFYELINIVDWVMLFYCYNVVLSSFC